VKSNPKKIAIIYSGAKHWGGVETYLELLFEHVDKSKIDLTLLSLGDWDLTDKLRIKNYKLQNFSASRINPVTVFRLTSYLRKNGFELVVSQGTVANAYARLAASWASLPTLVTVHSDRFYDYPNDLIRTVYSLIELLTRFATTHYIAVSEYLKKQLVASGVTEDKITVIYNGVAEIPGSLKQPMSSESQLIIGSIGRLHKVKNYAELIRACSGRKIDNWKLQIAGEGGERPVLERLISELGLTNRVELLGNVENVRELFSGWDIYIQPSLSEGFGLTVVEAMLAGKPVIVSSCGSLPELVEDEKTGIVMPGTGQQEIAAAIQSLAANNDKAKQLASAGQAFARENFSINKWVAETEKAFLEVTK